MATLVQVTDKKIINLDNFSIIERAESNSTTVVLMDLNGNKQYLFGEEARSFWKALTAPQMGG